MAMNTMFFAALAHVNAGIITTVWAVNPLYMALTDYFIFKLKSLAY